MNIIDSDVLEDIITEVIDVSNNQVECQTLRWVLDKISELPPREGKWIDLNKVDDEMEGCYECSNCKEIYFLYDGKPLDHEYNYCPKCGSRMNGGSEE